MAGPPVIEGSLKNTIHSLAFGLICATLTVNFGKYFVPHFFPYMVGILIAIEVVLFSLDRPKENYDKYQVPGIKGSHTIEGAGSPQIMVSAPGEDSEASPRKQHRVKDKLKTKKDQKGRRESGVPASPNVRRESGAPGSPKRQSLAPPLSPGQGALEAMGDKEMEHEKGGKDRTDKERKKEEDKAKKKEKEEEKERQKAEKKELKEKAKEEEAEKSEKSGWRKRKPTKQDTI